MKKRNLVLISFISFFLAMSIGYALFSETITVTGTATASGKFDVEFTRVRVPICAGFSSSCSADNIAQISSDKNSLNINVNKLEYPGAYVEIPITITNLGNIPIILESIDETGLTETNRAIKVTYSGLSTNDQPLSSLQVQMMTLKVEWDSTVNASADNVNFTITLNYKQATA